MFEFTINGKKVQAKKDKKLIDFIREDLKITSVKKGCGEGICGTCTILLQGKAQKSCKLNVSDVNGKEITTVEGLDEKEKNIYSWAFSKAGAVQCGYCTPGMVLSAKSLIDEFTVPNRYTIRKNINDNLCRCTGYQRIENAIEIAAKAFQEQEDIKAVKFKAKVGEKFLSQDMKDKVLGEAKYTDDITMDDMLYAKALRLDVARALIKNIDYSEAKKVKGVVCIIDKTSLKKGKYIGLIKRDTPVFVGIGEQTKCVSDALCAVAAESKEALKEALRLIKVEYDEIKPISSAKEALKKDADKIHQEGNILKEIEINKGDVQKAIDSSKYVVSNYFQVPFSDHAFLETESAISYLDEDKNLIVKTSSQSALDVKNQLIDILDIEEDKIKVIVENVGGSFGGKIDLTLQHHAALLALETKRPVKMTFSRKDSIKYHTKRHKMDISLTTACDESGRLTAMKAVIVADTGAYASVGESVIEKAAFHASGPYNYHNFSVKGMAVYTNNLTAGSYRGFGVSQINFAVESNLNKLAEKAGISAWEIRYKNAVEPGDILPNGQIADTDTALKETLMSVKDFFYSNPYVGVSCAMKNMGMGTGRSDVGKCVLLVKNEKVIIKSDIAFSGQGIYSALVQSVCETTSIPPEDVKVESAPIENENYSSSRHTFFITEAVRRAALKLKNAMQRKSLKKLNGEYFVGEYVGLTDPINTEKENPISHVSYAYATHCVCLDEEGKVKQVIASHDVGKAINPLIVESQIEGGVVMGLGYALTEKLPVKNCVPKGLLGGLGLLRAMQVPNIDTIIVEKNLSKLAYGAKGVAEISAIPTAAAVQGAYMKFDGIFRNKLPLEDTFYNKKKIRPPKFKINIDKI